MICGHIGERICLNLTDTGGIYQNICNQIPGIRTDGERTGRDLKNEAAMVPFAETLWKV